MAFGQVANRTHALLEESVDALGPRVIEHGDVPWIVRPAAAVEAALDGKQVGATVSVIMTPEQAFGEFEAELVKEEEVGLFPSDIEVGMVFETRDPETEETMQFRITKIDAGIVTVDGNHPLAGMTLRFEASVLAVRAASDEEVVHGHVHGEHGHQH